MEHTVDRLLVIGSGRIVADGSVASLLGSEGTTVRAASPDHLARALEAAGFSVHHDDGALVVPSAEPAAVGAVAAAAGIALTDLRPTQRGLEDVFFQLTEAAS